MFPCCGYMSKLTGEATASLVIYGSRLDPDFLSDLWAEQKKSLRKYYSVDVSATIRVNEEEDEVELKFLLNGAYASKHKIPSEIYQKRFQDTFDHWISDFINVIECSEYEVHVNGRKEEAVLMLCFPDKKARDERKKRKSLKKASKNTI